MRKCSPKFSGKLTPLTPPMLEVVTAVRAEHALHTEDLDIHPSSHHSDDSSAGKKAASPSSVASERPASPNDYTPTDEVQTSGGDEGHLDLHGLTREVLNEEAIMLTSCLNFLVKLLCLRRKKLKKSHKKKSSSFKQGRKKVSDGSTGLNEVDVNSGDSQMMDVDDTITTEVHEGTAQVNEGTAEVNESTVGANLSTEPSMKKVEDEAGPSTFQDESDEFIQDDILIADTLVNITRPRRGAGITIPGNISEQERPESTQIKCLIPKDNWLEMLPEEWEEEEEEKGLAAEQQAALRRSKPPTISQLRNQMMKYIRNVGGKAHRNLKNKSYEEILDIYEEVKRLNDKFVAIGSTEDEQAIKEMNVKAEEPSKKRKDFEGDGAQDVENKGIHFTMRAYDKDCWSIVRSSKGNRGCSEFNKICDEAKGGFGKRRRMILETSIDYSVRAPVALHTATHATKNDASLLVMLLTALLVTPASEIPPYH
ncbi:hypothetical protein Tco_0364482 [Tanacetum coccineum]